MTGHGGASEVIGVIGGSGFYEFLEDSTEVTSDTPWGAPSSPVHLSSVEGRPVAFLARHGVDHTLAPHRVNHRANLWALRDAGVSRVFGPCAAGSLHLAIAPGAFVVCDQLIDRTWGRPDTYFDGATVNHVAFADPYCPELRRAAVDAGRAVGTTMHPAGTVVVVQGPRFATRAESRSYRAMGGDVINMTQYPEAVLARELGLCYAAIALVTDYDAGLEDDRAVEPVTMGAVFAMMRSNVSRVRELLLRAIVDVPPDRGCGCADAPGGIEVVPPG